MTVRKSRRSYKNKGIHVHGKICVGNVRAVQFSGTKKAVNKMDVDNFVMN